MRGNKEKQEFGIAASNQNKQLLVCLFYKLLRNITYNIYSNKYSNVKGMHYFNLKKRSSERDADFSH